LKETGDEMVKECLEEEKAKKSRKWRTAGLIFIILLKKG
jgi:hypothetical protein